MSAAASQRILEAWLAAIPPDPEASVCEWGRKHFQVVGSALSETFDPTITPWIIAPAECAADGTRRMTFVKPIQSGGTSAGELAILYWLSRWNNGDVAYYWPSDSKSDDRWLKATEKRLRACAPVMARTSPERFKFVKGLIAFPHSNFAQLGAKSDRNVSSDSYRGIVAEELHDEAGGWTPGRLEQVFGRQTAHWNSIVFIISNAAKKGGQLYQSFEAGTKQYWEVRCPECKQFHRMRTRWTKEEAHLGGLRYDADGCRRADGGYDYNKLVGTIHFQMPCGFKVHDDVTERRALSLSGRYSEPTNPGAPLTHRSFTLEGVAIDYVPWLDLIVQKHAALRALKRGDPELWDVYKRERECLFTDPEDRPVVREMVLSSRKKDRAGLANRAMRYGLLDRQRGSAEKAELPHWWVLVQDWDEQGNSLVVWEGKCLTDGDVLDVLKRHDVKPLDVTADSGWDTSHVYSFCLQNGFCCIKVEGSTEAGASRTFAHPDDSRRIYSPPEPLHKVLGLPPTREDPAQEPRFWHISKWGAMERFGYVRASKELRWEVPSDVSEDFKQHLESWMVDSVQNARTGELRPTWRQLRERDDLYQLCCYSCVCAEMDGLIGVGQIQPEEAPAAP